MLSFCIITRENRKESMEKAHCKSINKTKESQKRAIKFYFQYEPQSLLRKFQLPKIFK